MENEKYKNQRGDEQVPHQLITRQHPAVDHTQVVYLPDANLDESITESSVDCSKTDRTNSYATQNDEMESKPISFGVQCEPTTSRNCTATTQNEAAATGETYSAAAVARRAYNLDGTNTETERMRNILDLLHRFSYNLDAIEERLQVPQQYCELGTQTGEVATSRRLRVDLTTRRSSPARHQPDSRPPCERSYHMITIAGNNLPPRQAVQRQTFFGRICRSLGDFFAAFCLCLQVNKDCVFCLGFFVAFVVSVSFLTAFFYRTINFKPTVSRVTAIPVTGSPQYELTPLRFSGGYYYFYNKNQRNLS